MFTCMFNKCLVKFRIEDHLCDGIQCPYLLKFVDIVLDVEVTTDLIIKVTNSWNGIH